MKTREREIGLKRKGLTLVEIMVVIALIAVLAGVLITKLDVFFESGKEQSAKIFVDQAITAPLMAYKISMGHYPSTAEGLQALVTPPTGESKKWKGPYLEKIPEDPWGRPYQYRFPGTHNKDKYDIWSLGPDGVEGADDIGNWD